MSLIPSTPPSKAPNAKLPYHVFHHFDSLSRNMDNFVMLCNINMDKFVTKSSSTCNSTGSKSKSNNYGKDCEITMKKKMTNEMTGRVFLDANPYWAGSNEVQIMLQVAKHGSFIFFPELGLATWFCKGSVTIINFDHCELIGISSSFCWASNFTR